MKSILKPWIGLAAAGLFALAVPSAMAMAGGAPKKPVVKTTTPHVTTSTHGSPHTSTPTHGPTVKTTSHGSAHTTSTTHGSAKTTHANPKATAPKGPTTKSTGHGKPQTTTTTGTGTSTVGGTTTTTPPNKAQQLLAKNTNLRDKLQSRLPAGTDVMAAASGFKNLGQFVAAVNVSRNLGIPFDQLKALMTGTPLPGTIPGTTTTTATGPMSLGQAIQRLKGTDTTTATQTANTATAEAETEIASTSTTTTTSATKGKTKKH